MYYYAENWRFWKILQAKCFCRFKVHNKENGYQIEEFEDVMHKEAFHLRKINQVQCFFAIDKENCLSAPARLPRSNQNDLLKHAEQGKKQLESLVNWDKYVSKIKVCFRLHWQHVHLYQSDKAEYFTFISTIKYDSRKYLTLYDTLYMSDFASCSKVHISRVV